MELGGAQPFGWKVLLVDSLGRLPVQTVDQFVDVSKVTLFCLVQELVGHPAQRERTAPKRKP
jgi:hypothetical protein